MTMHLFSYAIAGLAALGIIAIGIMYLATPRTMTANFGLPLPEAGTNVVWWLRLKGVRDIVCGLVVVAAIVWGGPRVLGTALLIEALVPLGDMSLVLAAGGSRRHAFGLHGLTAALMVASAIPLITGPG